MTKQDLQNLIVECLNEYVAEHSPQPAKDTSMTLKKTELKSLVNEIVRQCVKEASTQYKVQGKKSQLEEPGKRNKAREMQEDPEINEVAPPGGEDVVKAIKKSGTADNPWAVAWSMKNKGQIENENDEGGEEHSQYDEGEEIRLIKGLALIVLKLLKMHQGMEGTENEPESEEPVGEPEPKSEFPPKEKEDGEDLDENHKVQDRSFKTVKDLDNNPKNVRNPKVPQS